VGESELIEVRLDDLLERQQRSFYWLAKQTGISYTTLWRLKKARALGINFATLEKICEVLNCQPGDVLSLQDNQAGKRARVPAAGSKRKTS
jgi:putative transcriptional regulator